jgi:hypothetical protein
LAGWIEQQGICFQKSQCSYNLWMRNQFWGLTHPFYKIIYGETLLLRQLAEGDDTA